MYNMKKCHFFGSLIFTSFSTAQYFVTLLPWGYNCLSVFSSFCLVVFLYFCLSVFSAFLCVTFLLWAYMAKLSVFLSFCLFVLLFFCLHCTALHCTLQYFFLSPSCRGHKWQRHQSLANIPLCKHCLFHLPRPSIFHFPRSSIFLFHVPGPFSGGINGKGISPLQTFHCANVHPPDLPLHLPRVSTAITSHLPFPFAWTFHIPFPFARSFHFPFLFEISPFALSPPDRQLDSGSNSSDSPDAAFLYLEQTELLKLF